jgi:hypothetical protein
MRIIYAVYDGDIALVGIFSTRELAESWINKSTFRYGANIQELNLDNFETYNYENFL